MIVSLETLKQHLRVYEDYDDERIVLTLDQAHEVVFDYLKVDASDYGSPGEYDIDLLWAAAVLKAGLALYDDEDPIPAIENLLRRSRDPAMA